MVFVLNKNKQPLNPCTPAREKSYSSPTYCSIRKVKTFLTTTLEEGDFWIILLKNINKMLKQVKTQKEHIKNVKEKRKEILKITKHLEKNIDISLKE